MEIFLDIFYENAFICDPIILSMLHYGLPTRIWKPNGISDTYTVEYLRLKIQTVRIGTYSLLETVAQNLRLAEMFVLQPYLSQNWSSDGYFEVLNQFIFELVQKLWHKCKKMQFMYLVKKWLERVGKQWVSFITSKWSSELQFCERYSCIWWKNG